MTVLARLPFTTVLNLYQELESINHNNDISARTKLLRDYPELFDPTVVAEISTVWQQAVCASRWHRLIKIDFKQKKRTDDEES